MLAGVLNDFAREMLVADLDRKFCFKELALLNEGLPNIQCCFYCVLVPDVVFIIPSYSLKIIPEGHQAAVADLGMDLLDVGGVRHGDSLRILNARGMNLLLLLECSMVW